MKVTEKKLIDDTKELVIWSWHMCRAAMGLYEDQKYYDAVKRSGHGAEFYSGMSDAYHSILLQLIGGKELYKLDEQLWESAKDEDELN